MKEEATHLSQNSFSYLIQAVSLPLDLQSTFVLILGSYIFHHGVILFPPSLHHYLKERNQAVCIFGCPVFSTIHVNKSCPRCIYYIETNCKY